MGAEENLSSLFNGLEFTIAGYTFAPSYLHIAAILVLLFLLILTLAQVRRHFIDWSIKGSVVGIFLGFLLALVLEGFLILAGRTAVTEILGWKNAPEPLKQALDSGRGRLADVLGVTEEVPSSAASQNPDSEMVTRLYSLLGEKDQEKVQTFVCSPTD